MRERQRLGTLSINTDSLGRKFAVEEAPASYVATTPDDKEALRRPTRFWINVLLTTVLMGSLVLELLPLAVLFMIAFALALLINYPQLDAQRQRIAAHAPAALNQTSIFRRRGIFCRYSVGYGDGNGNVRNIT